MSTISMALAAILMLAPTLAAAAPGVSKLWGAAGEAWNPAGRLPNFSFAGKLYTPAGRRAVALQ